MIDRQLLEQVTNQEGLLRLLGKSEREGGLGWPIDSDFAFDEVPEIANGIKGESRVTVSRLVPANVDGEKLIILAEFHSAYVRRDLRELLTSLRRLVRESGRFDGASGLGDTVFIVVSPNYEDVRFVLFEEAEKRLPKMRSFGWRRDFIGRTVLTHNLERLTWDARSNWARAWDVEGLTEDFYNDFVRVFDVFRASTTHPSGEKFASNYAQQLLNRLLFISFIERMGWLRTPEGSADYLHAQWVRFQKRANYASIEPQSLVPASFNGLLGRLFFDALDNPAGVEGDPVLGSVPYLNGGLFSQEAELDVAGVNVNDEAFGVLLDEGSGLFRRYNFTVTESTPLDQEVAVDPEMLGKIFERLIIAEERHGTGTYYTPRPIVEFMVNEALKGYLVERGLPRPNAEMLVDRDTVESDALSFKPSEMQDTLNWLFEVKAVDPACGSGAYLLMLLQRLFELVDRLEVSRDKGRNVHQKHLYETKLRLLQRSVYGVDLNETAIRIARLRLWLSLVVENRGVKPDPLPNFDFLIMQGDSLASPLFPAQNVLGYPEAEIREYTRLKRKYFHPERKEARPTREEMAAKRAEISAAYANELSRSMLRAQSSRPFDWEVEFAEVFDPHESEGTIGGELSLGVHAGKQGQGQLPAASKRAPGFDIVLANPPYVNSGELLRNAGRAYKDALVASYPKTATGTADLLVFFMERAVDLLRPGGQFAFITSNKWLKAAYGQKLRGQMAARTHIHHLMDFKDLPVFQGTIAYPLITIATKRHEGDKGESTARFTEVTSLNPPYPDLPTIIQEWGGDLPPGSLGKDGTWRLAEMRERGIPLKDYLQGQRIYHGIQTSLNEVRVGPDGKQYGKGEPAPRGSRTEGVFIIDGAKRAELLQRDPKSAELIHPLAIGRDIRKWVIENNDRWMIVTPIGVPIDDYPAIRDHLARFKEKAEARREKGNHYWELRRCAYYGEFEKPKLVYQEIADKPGVALLPNGWYINNKAYMIPREDLYLMAVLNSTAAEQWLRKSGTSMMGGAVNMHTDMVQRIPIPQASATQREEIEQLVKRILDAKANPDSDVSELEAEIDRRVEFLYFGEGDSYEDALAKDVAEVRALLRPKIETAKLEFKETLWHDVRLGSVHGDRVQDVIKAICAMLNRDGGTILIGVNDDAEIVGIERDLEKLETPDKFQRKLQEAFGVKLRPDPADLIRVRFIPIQDAVGKNVQICRIDVKSDSSTMYTLNDKVYLRRDGASVEMPPVDTALWWSRRQKGEA